MLRLQTGPWEISHRQEVRSSGWPIDPASRSFTAGNTSLYGLKARTFHFFGCTSAAYLTFWLSQPARLAVLRSTRSRLLFAILFERIGQRNKVVQANRRHYSVHLARAAALSSTSPLYQRKFYSATENRAQLDRKYVQQKDDYFLVS